LSHLISYDFGEPTSPVLLARTRFGDQTLDLVATESYVYGAAKETGVHIYSAGGPKRPAAIRTSP
jgi:hypothetical protein